MRSWISRGHGKSCNPSLDMVVAALGIDERGGVDSVASRLFEERRHVIGSAKLNIQLVSSFHHLLSFHPSKTSELFSFGARNGRCHFINIQGHVPPLRSIPMALWAPSSLGQCSTRLVSLSRRCSGHQQPPGKGLTCGQTVSYWPSWGSYGLFLTKLPPHPGTWSTGKAPAMLLKHLAHITVMPCQTVGTGKHTDQSLALLLLLFPFFFFPFSPSRSSGTNNKRLFQDPAHPILPPGLETSDSPGSGASSAMRTSLERPLF